MGFYILQQKAYHFWWKSLISDRYSVYFPDSGSHVPAPGTPSRRFPAMLGRLTLPPSEIQAAHGWQSQSSIYVPASRYQG